MLKAALQLLHCFAAGVGWAVIAGVALAALGVGDFALGFSLALEPAAVDVVHPEPTLAT